MRKPALAAVFVLSVWSVASGYAATQAMPMPMPGKTTAAKPAPARAAEVLAITFKTDPVPPKKGNTRFDVTVTFVMAAMPI